MSGLGPRRGWQPSSEYPDANDNWRAERDYSSRPDQKQPDRVFERPEPTSRPAYHQPSQPESHRDNYAEAPFDHYDYDAPRRSSDFDPASRVEADRYRDSHYDHNRRPAGSGGYQSSYDPVRSAEIAQQTQAQRFDLADTMASPGALEAQRYDSDRSFEAERPKTDSYRELNNGFHPDDKPLYREHPHSSELKDEAVTNGQGLAEARKVRMQKPGQRADSEPTKSFFSPPEWANHKMTLAGCVAFVALAVSTAIMAPVLQRTVSASPTPDPQQPSVSQTSQESPSATPDPGTTSASTTKPSASTSNTPWPALVVGDCLKPYPLPSGPPRFDRVKCDVPEPLTYVVAVIGKGSQPKCPTDASRPYTSTALRSKDGSVIGFLCLALNLRKNNCYSLTDNNESQVACTDPKAQTKVISRLSVADPKQCKTGDITYPALKLTYCLAPPK